MSKQKETILRELRNLKTHPTADELYVLVKKYIPRISLGTVYRNLNQLADAGEIIRIEYGAGQKRFDGYIKTHYHFRCKYCDRVYDLDLNPLSSIQRVYEKIKDHYVEGYQLEFTGVCRDCRKMR